jgi:hypothetical protein
MTFPRGQNCSNGNRCVDSCDIMQMYAKGKYGPSEWERFDRFTVTMGHRTVSMHSFREAEALISLHPPFHQRERKDPSSNNHDFRRGHGRFDNVHDALFDLRIPRKNPKFVRPFEVRLRGHLNDSRGQKESGGTRY